MQYVIHRMIKALWIAVLVGIIAAGGIWAKTKLVSESNAVATGDLTPESNASITDHLQVPQTHLSENSTTTIKQVSLKKLLLFFALGFLVAEGVVFLIAIFNDTVKSSRDLTENTDLAVLDCSRSGQEHDWTALTVKIRANITNEDQLVVLRDADVSGREWIDQIKEILAENGSNESLPEITGLELSAEKLETLTNKKVLLAVKQEKTTYKTLRKLSDDLNQIHADVIGAIVEA